MLIHWLLIPVKVALITLVAWWHRARLSARWRYYCQDREPAAPNLQRGFIASMAAQDGPQLKPDTQGILRLPLNPDHEALRNGSFAWTWPTKHTIAALESYVTDTGFRRGEGSPYTTVPAMGMSVAHGITSGLKHGIEIPESLKAKFIRAAEFKMAGAFSEEKDTNVRPRVKSTAMDAIFALSLLYTAWRLEGKPEYLREANRILWKLGYAFLLLAPLTYKSDSDRRYFIDHIAIMGLRTAYLNAPTWGVRWLLKHALKFIHSQSYVWTNPYTSALAHECGALPESERKKVLDVHCNTDPLEACRVAGVVYNNSDIPSDYCTHSDDEFLFDQVAGRGSKSPSTTGYVSLNGMCLAASLGELLGQNIRI